MAMGLVGVNQGRGMEILWPSGPDVWPVYLKPVHQKIIEKGIDDILEIEELSTYKNKMKAGASWYGEDDWGGYRTNNHGYNPRTDKGKLIKDDQGKIYGNYASALEWGVTTGKSYKLDGTTLKEVINNYDWNDARAWYEKGHKVNAYNCLGHVVHLLQDVAMPSHCLPPKLSDLYKNDADIGLKDYKYEVDYIKDNYSQFLDDATQTTWKASINQQFYDLAINVQDKGKRYRKAYYQGTQTIIEQDSLDIYNLDYDSSDSIVYDIQQAKTIPAKDAYNSLLSSLLPEAISYSAGLLKYFYDTRPTPDSNKLDYIEHSVWSLGGIKIKETTKYSLNLKSMGDAITIPVNMTVQYSTKLNPNVWVNLLSETKNVALGTYNDTSVNVDTSNFTIPKEATQLRLLYTLNYGVKPSGTSTDIVYARDMEITCSPQNLYLNEVPQTLVVTVKDKNDGEAIDGCQVEIEALGISGTTNSSGIVTFLVNPQYARDDKLFVWLNIKASTTKYNYADGNNNILCIDRFPPNINNFGLSGTGSNAVDITWNTDVPSGGEVQCAGKVVAQEGAAKIQTVTLTGLSLGTTYTYTIKAWTNYSKAYNNFAYASGSFTTRGYNNPPKVAIISPEAGKTYKATCTVKYYVEDNDSTKGDKDRMNVTILYTKIDGTNTWKLIGSYTDIYTGTYSLIWKIDDVGSGTFQINVIVADWNGALSSAFSGTFTIIAPATITKTAQGGDGGKKGEWSQTFKTAFRKCPMCGKSVAYAVYIVQISTKEEWVTAEIPYGVVFEPEPEVILSINQGYEGEIIEKGTTACKVRAFVQKDYSYKFYNIAGEKICDHFYSWRPCSPSEITFTIVAKGFFSDQRKPFDFDPPVVRLLEPQGTQTLSGTQVIRWEATTKSRPIRISILYSNDQGETWIPIEEGLENTGTYIWKTNYLEDREGYLLKVRASNGVVAKEAISGGIKIKNSLPTLQNVSSDRYIIFPQDEVNLGLALSGCKDDNLTFDLNFTKQDGSLLWKEEAIISTSTEDSFVYTQKTKVPGTLSHTGRVDVRLSVPNYVASKGTQDNAGRYIISDLLIPRITQKDGKEGFLQSSYLPATIEYILPEKGTVSVAVWTLSGNKVKELSYGFCEAGLYSTSWDGRDTNGKAVADGTYIFSVEEVLAKLNYKTENKCLIIVNNQTIPPLPRAITATAQEVSQTEDEVSLSWNPQIDKFLFSYAIIPYGYNIYYQGDKIDTISANDIWQNIQGISTNPKFSLSPDLSCARYTERRLSKNAHYYSIAAIDQMAKEGSLTSFAVQTKDIYPPSVTISSFAQTLPNRVEFSFSGEDNIKDASLKYAYSLNQGELSQWSYKSKVVFENLAEGNYTFLVKAKDEGGNISQTPATKNFIIDLTPPIITNLKATPDNLNPGKEVKIVCYVTDNLSGVGSVTLNLSPVEGPESQQIFDVAGDGTYTYAYTIPNSVTKGKKTLVITAKDNFSNISTASVTVQITSISITPKSGYVGTQLTVSGEGYLPTEKIRIDFGETGTIAVANTDSNGNFTVTFITDSQAYTLINISATGRSSQGSAYNEFLRLPFLCDFGGEEGEKPDQKINIDDLMFFIQYWRAKNPKGDVGSKETTGKAPNLTYKPDGKVDIYDLLIFIQMWRWCNSKRDNRYIESRSNRLTIDTSSIFNSTQPCTVRLDPVEIASKDKEFEIDIRLESVNKLLVGSFLLKFDPEKLEIVSIEQGDLISEELFFKDTERGFVKIDVGAFNETSGTGKIATVRFKAISDDPGSDITLSEVVLIDVDGDPISFDLFGITKVNPSCPTNLKITEIRTSSYQWWWYWWWWGWWRDRAIAILEWEPVSDVKYYNIYQDGKMIERSYSNKYCLWYLPYGDHRYTVTAVDRTGKESKQAKEVRIERRKKGKWCGLKEEVFYLWGNNNSIDLCLVSGEYKRYTFYLYPKDSPVNSYKKRPIGPNISSWGYASPGSPGKDILMVRAYLFGWWWRPAYFNWKYTAQSVRSATNIASTQEIEKVENLFSKEKRLKPKAVFSLNQSTIRASSASFSVLLKDVEGDLSSAKFTIAFDSNKVNVEDVKAPILSESNLEISIEKKIDNIEGNLQITATIVDKEGTETSVAKTTRSQSFEMEDEIPNDVIPDDENVASIAQILIKPAQNRGMTAFSSEDILSSFSVDSVELKDPEGNLIETDVEEDESSLPPPNENQLLQSYPNPVNNGCYIPFKLSADSSQVTVSIYNIVGQKVRTIDVGPRKAGSYIKAKEGSAIFWDNRNDKKERVANGLYFYNLKAGEFSATKQVVIIK
jgi:flagellar hook assembly protein FlgD